MKKFTWSLLLFIIPFFISTIVPQMHGMDIATYNFWEEQYFSTNNSSIQDFYIYTDCNYPIVGALGSVGTIHLIKKLMGEKSHDFWLMAKWFRYSMTFFDAINTLIIYFFLSYLGISLAPYISLFFALTPSTWAASGVWGQLDGFGQFFIYLTILFNLFWLRKIQNENSKLSTALPIISFFLILPIIFNKQLMMFSLPYLGAFSLLNLCLHIQKTKMLYLFLAPMPAVFSAIWIDQFFNLKQEFKSMLAYIWLGGGSSHGDELSLNGFNIWVLLLRPMRSSSTEPLIGTFSPKQIGLFLFLVASFYLFYRLLVLFKKTLQGFNIIEWIAQFLLIHALSQLAFNLLLTGAHERYLYHFHPSLILGFMLISHLNSKYRTWVWIGMISSIGYGLFVWSTLFHPNDITTRVEHFIMLGFYLPFFSSLLWLEKKTLKSTF